jgi:hypothetical protein
MWIIRRYSGVLKEYAFGHGMLFWGASIDLIEPGTEGLVSQRLNCRASDPSEVSHKIYRSM